MSSRFNKEGLKQIRQEAEQVRIVGYFLFLFLTEAVGNV